MGLILTIDDFRAAVGVNVNFKLASVLPDLIIVEAEKIKPLVGPAFYNQLVAKLTAKEDLAAAEQQVCQLLQCAAATLAMVSYLPLNQVQISDGGVHIITDGSKKTAFQWQIKDLQAGFTRKGYNALERALDLLDENIDEAWAASWATSAAATASHRYFLNTARQFSEHYNIGDSRLTYLALLPTLRKVERFSLEPVLGTSFYLELKEQVLDRDLSTDNAQLLELFVRPALAHLVVAKAVPEIGLALSGDAIELNVYRLDDSNAKEADASIDNLLTMKVSQAQDDGVIFLEKLKAFLNTYASATRFATYFNSPTYQAPGGPRVVVTTRPDAPIYGWL